MTSRGLYISWSKKFQQKNYCSLPCSI